MAQDLTVTLPNDVAKAVCVALLLMAKGVAKAGLTPARGPLQDHILTALDITALAGLAADTHDALDEVAAARARAADADRADEAAFGFR